MRLKPQQARIAGPPPEWVVYDRPSSCPYLPGEIARLPLRLPARLLTRSELARRLAAGDRRQGLLLYRPNCPSCNACEPIRIDVNSFCPSRTQRRVLRRGEEALTTEVGRPEVTGEKVALYNRHKSVRGLRIGHEIVGIEEYAEFLVETCADTIELRYRKGGRLVGVAVADRGADALSAVYCYYDPADERLSPGVYSVLKQAELCRTWGLRYLYLGLYVAGCRAMEYKARYLPHERLLDGEWRTFTRGTGASVNRPEDQEAGGRPGGAESPETASRLRGDRS